MSKNKIQYGNNLIPIKQIVSRTKVRLQLKDDTSLDDEIRMFINECAVGLGTKPTFIKKNCKVKVCEGIGKLPCGFKKLIGVRVCHSEPDTNNELLNRNWNNELVYVERAYLDDCITECRNNNINPQINSLQGIIEIVGYEIRFPIPCGFTDVVVSYQGYATTDTGILELAAVYERGFSEYAVAKMLESYPQLYPPEFGNRENQIQRSLMDWTAQRAKLVSDSFADSFDNNQYTVKRMLNALLQSQNEVIIH